MSLKQKYWVLSTLLAVVLWLGLPAPSWAATPPASADAKVVHVINRLSLGPRPGDIEKVKASGIDAYIQSQLTPGSIPEPPALTQQLSRLDTLQLSPVELRRQYGPGRGQQPGQPLNPEVMKQAMQRGRKVLDQAIQARLLRATNSPRQLQEVMTDFWFNHFNIFSGKGLDRLWVGVYEQQAIRPYVFGKFRQLLGATAQHPALLFYLDNWLNTAPNSPGAQGKLKGLNENYARELLELHTLGVNGGYTQQDVIALARIFTGWGFARTKDEIEDSDGGFYFDTDRHDFGDKVFLGQTIKGQGMAEGEQALDILARHPATARYISYKLAQYFVADTPPESLVTQLSQRFQQTDGDLRAVLDTLFHSPEFGNPQYYNAKFKTPYQYLISTIRATDLEPSSVGPRKKSLPIFGILKQLGMPLYGCQSPDGYKNTEAAWLNPDSMLRRISLATSLANGLLSQEQPLNTQQLSKTLGNNFSPKTREVIESSQPQLRLALMLGSPEFMRR